MNSFILCSPQHAFFGVIGLLVCGLFTAEALESSVGGTASAAPTHQERGASADGSRAGTTLASVEMPTHYYR
jgi:hypothetical protein